MLDEIRRITTRPWRLMEVCGGQTHSIIRHGIDQLLPPAVDHDSRPRLPGLRHAAGTDRSGDRDRQPAEHDPGVVWRYAARARLAERPVPGQGRRAAMCASSIRRWNASRSRRRTPTKRSCSSASASRRPPPPTRWPSIRPKQLSMPNFSLLVSHVRVPPALDALLSRRRRRGAGISAGRARLRRDGLLGISPAGREVPRADGRHRLRAAGRRAGHPA